MQSFEFEIFFNVNLIAMLFICYTLLYARKDKKK